MSEDLRNDPLPYEIWGREHIDEESIKQMDSAMRLPVSAAGALMPDAHLGYGLPIGGVLATEGVVIPYAVGVDIACRMRMSIFNVSPNVLGQQSGKFRTALTGNTLFGAGKEWNTHSRREHEVLDEDTWNNTGILKSLKDKAYRQLGTSGSGNHFVEWGELEIQNDDNDLNLKAGRYLALLSHSGSRGVGYKIADYYSKIAQQYHPDLDKSVKHLAWLPMDWDMGQEYWEAMQIAGRFAAANHQVIHDSVAKAAGLKISVTVENHHNFAWKESIALPDGSRKEVIVHRKGATPAQEGQFGIIPGSMGDAGYIVKGKGNEAALNSASHGAGRLMSRSQARKTITKTEQTRYLKAKGITLIGGDLDESPQVYKDIDTVINAQDDLISVVGKFSPRIVRMDGK